MEFDVTAWAKILPSLFAPHSVAGATIIAFWGIYKNKLSTIADRIMSRLVGKMQNTPLPTIQISAKELLANKSSWMEDVKKENSAYEEIIELWSKLEKASKQSDCSKYWLYLVLFPLCGIFANSFALIHLPSEGVLHSCSWQIALPFLFLAGSFLAALAMLIKVIRNL